MATLRPQPLPANIYTRDTRAPLHAAYEQCLRMEADGGADSDTDTQMLARCLGYLILELPNEASGVVAQEIMDCGADVGEMKALARLYINNLIRLFRGDKGRTPAPSEHSSRSSFETRRRSFSDAVDAAPMSHQAAKISALRRDNYRCVVSGGIDVSSVKSMRPEDLERYNIDANSLHCLTNYCHIFPPSTNWGFDPNDHADKKKKYAGSVWAIFESFSIDVLSELNGEKIHHLGNGFTMDMTLHTMFDALNLWFEHDAGDTYRVCTVHPHVSPFIYLPPNPTVTFTSTDPSLPLPRSDYLRLHAAVCRVAHMSGAAGYLDREEKENERLGVLACDGSSADFLTSRLMHVALVA
ncbi:hypothetical protein BJ912DRAFT_922485 [Pholiota molesta]|nr:hypothetical protein BJ912DRAFT_922485 [Pholiota molesta]